MCRFLGIAECSPAAEIFLTLAALVVVFGILVIGGYAIDKNLPKRERERQ